MSKSQETFNKKDVRNKKEKRRKEKEMKKLARKENKKTGNTEDIIAYVDEKGMLSSTPPDPNKREVIKLENIEINTPKRESVPETSQIRKGIVTVFYASKGYGFIRDMETQESIFVHINNFLEDIQENNVVSFEIGMGQKGPAAMNVKLFK